MARAIGHAFAPTGPRPFPKEQCFAFEIPRGAGDKWSISKDVCVPELKMNYTYKLY